MKLYRFGEHRPIPQRKDRFYQDGDAWYFSIRKGPDQGPYKDETEAKAALVEFIQDEMAFEKDLANATKLAC